MVAKVSAFDSPHFVSASGLVPLITEAPAEDESDQKFLRF